MKKKNSTASSEVRLGRVDSTFVPLRSGWSWRLPVAFLFGGLGFVMQSYLSRQEASHVFLGFVDGLLVIGTVGLLFFQDATSKLQWIALILIAVDADLV